MGDRGPAVIAEAKKLDEPFEDHRGDDAVKPGNNGRRCTVYDIRLPRTIEHKMVVSFDLKEPLSAEVCRKALALWRAIVASDQGILAHYAAELATTPSQSLRAPPGCSI